MTDEERREMTRNNYYALMRASHCDSDGNPDPDFIYVVRCQNCSYGNLVTNMRGELMSECNCPDNPIQESKMLVDVDWYCPWGERKE